MIRMSVILAMLISAALWVGNDQVSARNGLLLRAKAFDAEFDKRPGLQVARWLQPMPTPGGVPVEITSPGAGS